MDDNSISSDLLTLEKYINKNIESEASTGLKLFNAAKCEIIMVSFTKLTITIITVVYRLKLYNWLRRIGVGRKW